jgi:hypothetical protein
MRARQEYRRTLTVAHVWSRGGGGREHPRHHWSTHGLKVRFARKGAPHISHDFSCLPDVPVAVFRGVNRCKEAFTGGPPCAGVVEGPLAGV